MGCVRAEPTGSAGIAMRPARLGSRPTAQTVFAVLDPLTMLTCWLDCVPSSVKSCDSALKSG